MKKSIIAVVGRPNVGKSSLFNALAGERISIVHDRPGVTRDRIYQEVEWYGREFLLVDTGGLDPGSEDPMKQQIARQVGFALETADLVIFVTDVHAGVTAGDREIAHRLLKSGLPSVLAVNKCDNPGSPPPSFYEFYELGIGEPVGISAAHKRGLGDLMSAALEKLPEPEETEEDDERIRIAVIGKPNAGKSSLVNQLLEEERTIVSDVAGTTRDALDVDLDNEWGRYTLIDTAGLRRRSKVKDEVEKYSILRTKSAVDRADVCLIMIDATDGLCEQDLKVAGLANEAGKASILVVNKWDLLDEKEQSYRKWEAELRNRMGFMHYAPIVTISAKTGQRVDSLWPLINEIYEEAGKRLGTGVVNEVLAEALALHEPPAQKGRRLKIYYATQVANRPPRFIFFINDTKLLHFSYERYMENQLREAFGFKGSPMLLLWREKKSRDHLQAERKKEN